MLKKITRIEFVSLILLVLMVGVGIQLFYKDFDRRNINLNENNIEIKANKEWTNKDVEIEVVYSKTKSHIKEYSYDNGNTWTTNNKYIVKSNRVLNIIVKDVNNRTYSIDYEVTNIDKEGPVILNNSVIEVKQNSKVDLLEYLTIYDSGAGLRDDIVITPKKIDTTRLGNYNYLIYAIDKQANKTIGQITVSVVRNPKPVVAKLLNLKEKNITMEIGDTKLLETVISPIKTADKRIIWTSSNPEVATVKNGTVNAVAAGTVKVSAKTVNGLTDTCTIIVK